MPSSFLLLPVEREGVGVKDGGVLRVVLRAVQRLQVLHQLHHRVVVLDLPETGEGLAAGLPDRQNSVTG